MAYSPQFEVLYDEKQPVGRIGRGTHYTVLRTLVPPPPGNAQERGWSRTSLLQLTFAVIWDEDHDDRIIRLLERLHVRQLLAPIRFIGERKGILTVLFDNQSAAQWAPSGNVAQFEQAVNAVAEDNDDSWPANVHQWDTDDGLEHLVQDKRARVRTYVDNIANLWPLGMQPWRQMPVESM